MKIHYFQRYHQGENVATANTMLLLSRLYHYSSDKFFRFLKSEIFSDDFDAEISFVLQEKNETSVPDATISQDSFKIIVETKLNDWFYSKQLMEHIKALKNYDKKVLVTLSSENMDRDKFLDVNKKIVDTDNSIIHINTTFEKLAKAIAEVLDDRDYDMQEVLDDYVDYCYHDKLIPNVDSWKFLRMQLTSKTFDFNLKSNVYYENAERGFRAHTYLGLYTAKSLRAIGKICAQIKAVEKDGEMTFTPIQGEVTQERIKTIEEAISDGLNYGYNLRNTEHNYFFVEKFYETDFKKVTPRAPMGTRIFDLTEVLGTNDIPQVDILAEELKKLTWGLNFCCIYILI